MAKIDWHVARISYGKDSLKMLEVIRSRGLPLDQITTTDVWATDTIPANLPPVQEFKDRMDQWIWDNYRIMVDHLCARNKDGSKRTYEQMFYHVPQRKNSQSVQVERERERETGFGPDRSRDSRYWGGLGVSQNSRSELPPPMADTGRDYRMAPEHRVQLVRKTQVSRDFLSTGGRYAGARTSRPNGFPATISPWCRKLKIFR